MLLAEMTFEEAKESFQHFLAENDLGKALLWVFNEDVYSRIAYSSAIDRDFWLKLPLPRENEKLAQRQFEMGKTRGFGVSLTAFASCDDGICCSFYVPKDDEDAAYHLIGPRYLKMSFISRDMPMAKPVRSELKWRFFGLLGFRHQIWTTDELASKSDLR